VACSRRANYALLVTRYRFSTPDPATDIGRVFFALRHIRKGAGLTEAKLANISEVLNLPIIRAEAAKHRLPSEEVAFALFVALIRRLEPVRERPALSDAWDVDYSGRRGDLGVRRLHRNPTDSGTCIEHEDAALVALVRRLLSLRDPDEELGDYLTMTRSRVNERHSVIPRGADEFHHPAEETVVYQENWYIFERDRMIDLILTFVTLQAQIDGVTGTTYPHLALPGTKVDQFEVLSGGRKGIYFPPRTAPGMPAQNIVFNSSLRRDEQVNLVVTARLLREGQHEHRWVGLVPGSATTACKLRVQFAPNCLPAVAYWYLTSEAILPEPIDQRNPIQSLHPGYIEKRFPHPTPGEVCCLGWDWE